ncbi:MAG: hypothetical protein FJX77_12025, partial [Armatimonadetes bacterium]|nr:hypothetical protein [Armatimonadota bacterium]
PNYPAAYPDVLSVGASDAGDVLALFSSHGPWVRCTAPGVGIWSTVPGSYFGADGTSMAAPHVAGAAAVLLSHDPGLTPAGIRSLLQATRSSVTLPADRTLAPGAGRVNLGEALRKLGTPAVLSEVTTGQARLVHSGVGTGRVRLTSAAGEGGALVALTCDPVGILRVPAAVLVGPGEQSAEFTFAVHAPAGATYATLHATYRGRTQSVRVLVTPSEASLTTLEVLQIPLTAGSPGTGLVALNLPAPSPGADILLQSSSQAVRVPVAVRIPAGDKSVGFPISTAIAASPVTARLAASWQGTSVQADAPVLPRLESLAIEPTSVPGGNTTEGRLTLRMAAARGGVPVRLSVSDRRYVSLPATVRVPAGATQVRFTIRTRRVRVSQSVELQATLDGAVRRARLDLTP